MYKTYTQFLWKESFEGVTVSLTRTINSDTTFKVIQNAFDGTKSLAGYLDATRHTFEYASEKSYVLQTNSTPVFLELNYKTNSPILIGFIANTSGISTYVPGVTLNSTLTDNGVLEWNKIYINLRSNLQYFPSADNFKIYFRVDKPEDIGTSEFFIDNIKLVE